MTETTFSVNIESGNAAFDGDYGSRTEVSRLLSQIVDRIQDGADSGMLHDINGNSVGSWDLDIETEVECDCGNMMNENDERCDECQAIEDRALEEDADREMGDERTVT